MKIFRDFLPEPQFENCTKILQTRVTPAMSERIKTVAKKNGWTPSDVVRAGLLMFLNEEPTYKKPIVN